MEVLKTEKAPKMCRREHYIVEVQLVLQKSSYESSDADRLER